MTILDKRGGHNRIAINRNFFKVWSPKMAYTLGLAFADGSLVDSKPSRSCYFKIHSSDKELLEQINSVLDRHGKIYCEQPRLIKKKKKNYQSKICYYIGIGSKLLYEDLIQLGLTPKKSMNMAFPEVPQKLLPFFVRGYLDGDGCIHIGEKNRLVVAFSSGSKVFLETLAELLATALFVERKNIHFTGGCFQLRYSTRESKKILDYIYENLDTCPFLKRKYNKYQEWRGTQMGRVWSAKP